MGGGGDGGGLSRTHKHARARSRRMWCRTAPTAVPPPAATAVLRDGGPSEGQPMARRSDPPRGFTLAVWRGRLCNGKRKKGKVTYGRHPVVWVCAKYGPWAEARIGQQSSEPDCFVLFFFLLLALMGGDPREGNNGGSTVGVWERSVVRRAAIEADLQSLTLLVVFFFSRRFILFFVLMPSLASPVPSLSSLRKWNPLQTTFF